MSHDCETKRVVLLEEDGLPHFTGHEGLMVLVLHPNSRSSNDPVKEYTTADVDEEDGPWWFVQRDLDVRFENGASNLTPVAASLGLEGEQRSQIHASHLLYWSLRAYLAIREELGIDRANDPYTYTPFDPITETAFPTYDDICRLVGQAFGPIPESDQQ